MLKYRFLPKLFIGLSTVVMLSGCTEAISFGVGFGAGFFSGMQYQKSEIKGENSVYMGGSSESAAAAAPLDPNAGGAGAYPNSTGGYDYYASGAPTAQMDPYGGGTYPAPSPVYSAPLPGSASMQAAPPPLASAAPSPYPAYNPAPQAPMGYSQQGYGMAPPIQPYGGGAYYNSTPAPFGTQGQLRPSAYSYTTIQPARGSFW